MLIHVHVLPGLSHWFLPLQELPLDENFTASFNNAYLQLGGLGERVLGLAGRFKLTGNVCSKLLLPDMSVLKVNVVQRGTHCNNTILCTGNNVRTCQ